MSWRAARSLERVVVSFCIGRSLLSVPAPGRRDRCRGLYRVVYTDSIAVQHGAQLRVDSYEQHTARSIASGAREPLGHAAAAKITVVIGRVRTPRARRRAIRA